MTIISRLKASRDCWKMRKCRGGYHPPETAPKNARPKTVNKEKFPAAIAGIFLKISVDKYTLYVYNKYVRSWCR